jgi:hypothetical protein
MQFDEQFFYLDSYTISEPSVLDKIYEGYKLLKISEPDFGIEEWFVEDLLDKQAERKKLVQSLQNMAY